MSGMYFGVTALEGKIGATQRVTGRWNMNCLLTQLCELRPKTHAICAELFVAGNFVTKKKKISKMQIEMVFTRCFGIVHLSSHWDLTYVAFSSPCPFLSSFERVPVTPNCSLLVSLVTNDFQFFICRFLVLSKISLCFCFALTEV